MKNIRGIMPLLGLVLALPAAAQDDLAELDLEKLLETTVTGASKYEQKQSEVAAAVSVITRDEIKAFGWRTVADALQSLPGIHTTYDRQYTYLGTRGFGLPGDLNVRAALAINGNRLNDTVYDAAVIGREFPLDLDMVERIEFIPGPGGAVYGQNAMFGVVNVVTRTGAQVDGGELSGAWQSPQARREGRVTWGKVLDNGLDVLFSASGMHSRGEDLFMTFPGAGPGGSDVAGVATRQDGERDKEFFLRLSRGPLSFDVLQGNRRKSDPTAGFLSDPLVDGHHQRDEYLVSQVQYQDRFAGDTVNLLGRLFVGRYRFSGLYHYAGSPNHATGASDWRGGELRAVYSGIANHKLMLGLEVQESSRIEQTNDDLTTPGIDTSVRRSGRRFGLYAQDEWRFAEKWATTLGLRVDDNAATGTKVSPRAALIWQASPAATVKALYGRAYRPPNSYERDFNDGVSLVNNPALKGEMVDTGELVLDLRLSRDLSLRGSVFEWKMRDLVTLGTDPVSGLPQYQSGEKILAKGAEFSAVKTWNSGARLRGSLSHQDVAFVSGAELPNSPQWLGKLLFSGPLPWAGLRVGAELHYGSKRRAIDGSYLDGYWLANLNLIAAQWMKGAEVSFGIRNLFDKRYQHPGADTNWQTRLDQDGRIGQVKLDYRF
jgi:iron complex outermembrane receptor protein